jgi:hypothetical protein
MLKLPISDETMELPGFGVKRQAFHTAQLQKHLCKNMRET